MERTQLLCSAVKKPGAPSTSDLVLTWTVGAGGVYSATLNAAPAPTHCCNKSKGSKWTLSNWKRFFSGRQHSSCFFKRGKINLSFVRQLRKAPDVLLTELE